MKTVLIDQSFQVLTLKLVYDRFAENVERYGRVCYKSEKKITKDSAESFTKRIIACGHESVLEHCNLTIKFITDRATANCLVRHRHCAFSQESTHYINYLRKDSLFIIKQMAFAEEKLKEAVTKTIAVYSKPIGVASLVRRALLPLCLKTELVMTTNLREWRYILKIRTQVGCHPQMRCLMLEVLEWFKENLSIFVVDI